MGKKKKRTSRQKGFAYERILARKLWSHGFAVIRGPGSGGGSKDIVQPDLVAIKNGVIYAFEVKVRWKKETVYISREKIQRLLEFARRAGGKAFIAIKVIDHIDWKFIPVEKLEITGKGNYKINIELLGNALTLSGLVGSATRSKDLSEYL